MELGRKPGKVGGGGLLKQHSWSPDTFRDEAWVRRKAEFRRTRKSRMARSVTDEDLDELRGAIDLGFGFESPEVGSISATAAARLSETIPALDFYYAVQRSYYGSMGRGTSPAPSETSSATSIDDLSFDGNSLSILSPGDRPEAVKTRLKQWAQAVACSVRQNCWGRSVSNELQGNEEKNDNKNG